MNNQTLHPLSAEKKSCALDAWLRVSLVPGMSSRLFNGLLDHFQTPDNILGCSQKNLLAAGIRPGMAKKIRANGNSGLPPEIQARHSAALQWIQGDRHLLLTRHCNAYPPVLAEIPDPPPLLFLDGNPELLTMPMLAIVGSRNPSEGGRKNAFCFARELARAGVVVTSGLALGVDVASHEGALDGGGLTAAVLGTGPDLTYPASNRMMFERIAAHGALLSEFCPGTPPIPANFPRRNRIISGLSQGVLVVEASLRSGSMITARCALEQGREVFAIPGSIHNPMARGCHRLIAEGAKLVECVEDIIEECPGLGEVRSFSPSINQAGQSGEETLQDETAAVKKAIGYDPVTLDEIVRTTGIAVQHTNVALIELELLGLIRKENTGYVLSRA